MELCVNEGMLLAFRKHLLDEERSCATVEKYLHDVRVLHGFVGNRLITKESVLAYKRHLIETYAVSSANSMIAAMNAFFRFCSAQSLCVKQYKVQTASFVPEERELSRDEYLRLVRTASEQGNVRLSLILQTICATGIRVSELPYITVDAVRRGEAQVRCKGKSRRVILVSALRNKLLRYIKKHRRYQGAVFVTRSGKPISRHNIWRDMKALCASAGVPEGKVFPHNLRHLFARTFYGIEKDIVKLANILGHSGINTTRIYIATTASEHKKHMETMHLLL